MPTYWCSKASVDLRRSHAQVLESLASSPKDKRIAMRVHIDGLVKDMTNEAKILLPQRSELIHATPQGIERR